MNIKKLSEAERIEVRVTEASVDNTFVKQFREKQHLTQVALANVLGVKKKTVEKWEQGANPVNGSSAVLLKLLNDNPGLISQLYSVQIMKGPQKKEEFRTIESKTIEMNVKSKKPYVNVCSGIAAIY